MNTDQQPTPWWKVQLPATSRKMGRSSPSPRKPKYDPASDKHQCRIDEVKRDLKSNYKGFTVDLTAKLVSKFENLDLSYQANDKQLQQAVSGFDKMSIATKTTKQSVLS